MGRLTALADWQSALMSALQRPDAGRTGSIGLRADIAPERLSIHRATMLQGPLRVLEDVYPTVLRIVGADCMRQLARAHIRRCPPRHADVARSAMGFAETLAGLLTEEASLAELPYLADLARLEWARRHAREAPVAPTFDWTSVAAEAAHRIRLVVCPSLTRVASPYPLAALLRGDAPAAMPDTPLDLVVWWRGEDVAMETAPPALATALAAALAGVTLDRLTAEHGAHIAPMVGRGWLVGAEVGG